MCWPGLPGARLHALLLRLLRPPLPLAFGLDAGRLRSQTLRFQALTFLLGSQGCLSFFFLPDARLLGSGGSLSLGFLATRFSAAAAGLPHQGRHASG